MKLFVSFPGYKKENIEGYEEIDIQNISQIDDASCEHIQLNECLDYVRFDERQKLLQEVIKKLRYGGNIEIQGVDLLSLSNNLKNGRMTTKDINKIYLNGRKSNDTLRSTVGDVQSSGITIEMTKIDDPLYYIKGKRPDVTK